MSKLTITEALAEIKTIEARITKKHEFIGSYIARQEGLRDPLEKQGGSGPVIKQELQSIRDLGERKLSLRRAIQIANENNEIGVNGTVRSIADWLVWRREVAPGMKSRLETLSNAVANNRRQAIQKGFAVVSSSDAAGNPTDMIVNIDEGQLSADIEQIVEILGTLDGLLSLKNATITIDL